MVAKMGAGSSGDAFGPFYRVEGGSEVGSLCEENGRRWLMRFFKASVTMN
jgi:hypothetical protein